MRTKRLMFTMLNVMTIVVSNSVFAAPALLEAPMIGHTIPDYVFTNVTHHKTKTASISSFRGKWLFLDFWSNGCAGCVKSFPELSAYQKEFRDQSTWVLVGQNDLDYQNNSKDIERFYEKMRAKQGYDLISIYDSVLFDRWSIPFVSYVYVIDPQGTLRYITDTQGFSSS